MPAASRVGRNPTVARASAVSAPPTSRPMSLAMRYKLSASAVGRMTSTAI